MTRVPSSEQMQVNFRMPKDLKALIKVAAVENGRSLNAEIIHALEQYYSTKGQELAQRFAASEGETTSLGAAQARTSAIALLQGQLQQLEKMLHELAQAERGNKN